MKRWIVVVGAAAMLLAGSAVSSPSASADPVLYDQIGVGSFGVTSTDSPDDAQDSEIADDFVVPASTTWNITTIVLSAFDASGEDTSSFRVRIYDDASGSPGTMITEQTASGVGTNLETITANPAISLSSGTYWLSIQALSTNWNWYWDSNEVATGSPGMFRNPGLAFGSGCPTFVSTASCFSNPDAADQKFQLQGTATAGGPLCEGLVPTITGSGTINGTSGPDVIQGSAGPDTITGGGGADTICAGDGDDIVRGGGGGDTINGGLGLDQLFGNAGDDVMAGGADNDVVKGQDGSDQIAGGQGNDKLAGGQGDDFISGGQGNDKLFGGEGVDKANGSDGDDVLFGDAGDDDLRGNAGDDSLDGGDGADVCKGGAGTNSLDACND